MKKLITHNGSFHADDIFACATLSLFLEKENEKYEIIRTRDEETVKNGDYVFDVGGVYDADANRFDHHQAGGAGQHDSLAGKPGIEYASFGLVWKKFGEKICADARVAGLIDQKLVAPVDAGDNGIVLVENINEVSPYLVQHVFYAFRPTWREENITDDAMFLKCVQIAKEILSREIIQMQDALMAEEAVISSYKNSADKRIVVLDKNYPYEYTLNNFPEPLFVIYPRETDNTFSAKAIRTDIKTFGNRKDFPQSWGGLRDEELRKTTGVSDAVFCHRGLFMVVAQTKEGAIKLAQIAIES